jgi:hypothetical protein
LLPFSQLEKVKTLQRMVEQIEQEPVISWIHHSMQKFAMLPNCAFPELTQFHPSVSATPPGEHNISPALRKPHSPAQLVGRFHPLDKSSDDKQRIWFTSTLQGWEGC